MFYLIYCINILPTSTATKKPLRKCGEVQNIMGKESPAVEFLEAIYGMNFTYGDRKSYLYSF